MSGTQRPFAVTAILTISLIIIPAYLALGIIGFAPYAERGFGVNFQTGAVTRVDRDGPAYAAGVRRGDHLLDVSPGNVVEDFAFRFPQAGDRYRIRTTRGVVTVRAFLTWPDQREAVGNLASVVSTVVLIAFAVLLYTRRPGPMAFAFWLNAILSLSYSSLYPFFERLPIAIGAPVALLLGGLIGWAYAVPLIPFALRFPNDHLSPGGRRTERIAWILFGPVLIAGCCVYAAQWMGWLDPQLAILLIFLPPTAPLPIAAAILIRKYLRESPTARAQTAWALTGFAGAFVCQVITEFEGALQIWFDPLAVEIIYQVLTVAANLLPLLAIYPILRFRLFDLGFVVNRATLYSVLTLAALATLAGANWVAQRLVTERMAIVVQPLAAIVIGLGYFRVREWTQSVLERFLFRERFAAERHIEAMARGLALAKRPSAIDETLVGEAAETLSLRSAAVFRLQDEMLRRTQSQGWNEGALAELEPDNRLVRRLLADGPVASLRALKWDSAELPAPPNEPVVAIVLERAGALLGIVFYGRHRNGTEIDPEEVRMLQRLCEVAAAVYETVEMRAQVAELRAQLAVVR